MKLLKRTKGGSISRLDANASSWHMIQSRLRDYPLSGAQWMWMRSSTMQSRFATSAKSALTNLSDGLRSSTTMKESSSEKDAISGKNRSRTTTGRRNRSSIRLALNQDCLAQNFIGMSTACSNTSGDRLAKRTKITSRRRMTVGFSLQNWSQNWQSRQRNPTWSKSWATMVTKIQQNSSM